MPRLKTHEEFLEDFEKAKLRFNDLKNLEVVSEYTGAKNRITLRCNIHGKELVVLPTNILFGKVHCPECRHLEREKDFKVRLKEISPNIEVINEYINTQIPVKVRCTLHNFEWEARPANLVNGSGCKICSKKLKYTTETFKEEMLKVNPNIEILGEYVPNNSKITFKCKLHNYEGKSSSTVLLKNTACPECTLRGNRLTHEEFLMKATINPTVEILGKYTRADKPLKTKCKLCGKIWEPLALNVARGTGCPRCMSSIGKKLSGKPMGRPKRTEAFKEKLASLNPNLEIISEYIASNKPLTVRCKIDGNVFTKTAQHFIRYPVCLKCQYREGGKSTRGRKNMSHEEFESRVHALNPDLKLLSKYSGTSKPIAVECKRDNTIFAVIASELIRKPVCPYCGNNSK